MQSARVDMFFSCSFKDEDREINEFFLAICEALDIKCTNVDGAYSSVPPEVAKKQINNSQGLIAIATKRNELKDGKFAMPQAVQEELSIAYGTDTPLLLFAEDCLSIEGMKSNYGTYMQFSRDNLFTKENLEKVIRSIHNLKMEIVMPHDLIYEHETIDVISYFVYQLVELKDNVDGFIWAYSTTKKLQFTNTFKKHIPINFWATVRSVIPDETKNICLELELQSHSRDLTIIKEPPDCSKSLLKIAPHPEKGDFIEYSYYAESKYFNPIFKTDIEEDLPLIINGKSYSCWDGFIPIQRTKKTRLEYRFPSYGIKKSDITFFVGSYTVDVDYVVESELKRIYTEVDDIGGNIVLRIKVESPLLRHMYGIAWNPVQQVKKDITKKFLVSS